MPITQERMLAVISAAQEGINRLDSYIEAIRFVYAQVQGKKQSSDDALHYLFSLAAHDTGISANSSAVIASEAMHFKHTASRNARYRRRMQAERGVDENGQIPNNLPKPQFPRQLRSVPIHSPAATNRARMLALARESGDFVPQGRGKAGLRGFGEVEPDNKPQEQDFALPVVDLDMPTQAQLDADLAETEAELQRQSAKKTAEVIERTTGVKIVVPD